MGCGDSDMRKDGEKEGSSNEEIEKQLQAKYEELYAKLDTSGDGKLDASEIAAAYKTLHPDWF